jgi:hypothetical protein
MKKIMLTIFVIFNVNVLYSNDVLKDSIYNGNLLPLDSRIMPQHLMDFNLSELRMLRNMIYAKYNYKFQSNDLQEYFSQFLWYSGTKNDVERDLTYMDHRNIFTIKTLEEHYPVIIPYNDERINDFLHNLYNEEDRYWSSGVHNKYRNQSLIGNFLVIMGWGSDGELFCSGTTTLYNSFDISRERFNTIIEAPESERNIIPISEIILTNIEGYSIYSKEIRHQPDPRYMEYYYTEIGLKNNLDNSTIKLGDVTGYGYRSTGRWGLLTEDNIFYLCIRSPFEDNIVALIVIVPSMAGGDRYDGPVTYYSIFRIDLNALHEIDSPDVLERDFFMR